MLFDKFKDAIGLSERVLLVSVEFNKNKKYSTQEFLELGRSSGVEIVEHLLITRNNIDAQFLIGSGKVAEITQIVSDYSIEVVIFSQRLSPSQQRNLERALNCRVMDRVALILDIFALRAQSFEGKLQVELAQLKHMSTRLIKGWSHLERQKGGVGLRGPGETQLETDKRLIQKRINNLQLRLAKTSKQRNLARNARAKNNIPIISLVGYTNAGKSSLFNALTNNNIYTDDKLFATLDTTLRRITLPASGEAIIADTVGFINDLPYDLIDAFKATLEETRTANILILVIDVTDTNYIDKIKQVQQILIDIGAGDIKTIFAYNKIDKTTSTKAKVIVDTHNIPEKIWLSAHTGEGLKLLTQAISQNISGIMVAAKIKLSVYMAKFRSEIYKVGFIENEKVNKFGEWVLEISVTKHYLEILLLQKGITLLWQQKTPQLH